MQLNLIQGENDPTTEVLTLYGAMTELLTLYERHNKRSVGLFCGHMFGISYLPLKQRS